MYEIAIHLSWEVQNDVKLDILFSIRCYSQKLLSASFWSYSLFYVMWYFTISFTSLALLKPAQTTVNDTPRAVSLDSTALELFSRHGGVWRFSTFNVAELNFFCSQLHRLLKLEVGLWVWGSGDISLTKCCFWTAWRGRDWWASVSGSTTPVEKVWF